MIFSRRRIQSALLQLSMLTARESQDLAARLNRGDTDTLAAMWEVMLLRSFSDLGNVQHHRETANGKRPDVYFQSQHVTFTADISCVSDEGIQEQNPFRQFQDEIEHQKRKLGLGIGGVYLQAGHHEGERKVKLKLPALNEIPAFVEKMVIPAVADELAKGSWPVFIRWQTEDIEFDLTIKDGPMSGGGSRAYDIPKTVKSNPVYSRLRKKAAQVSQAEGLRGLILCDAGYSAFTKSVLDAQKIDASKIATSFLKDSKDVDFVALIWVHQETDWARQVARNLRCELIQKSSSAALSSVFEKCLDRLPPSKRTGKNALNHIRWKGPDHGFGGGYTMQWPSVKLSSKMLLNVLSGRMSIEDLNERLDWRSAGVESRGRWLNVFERALQEGRLPETVTIDRSPDEDDDWVTINFGPPDAAAGPFQGKSS